MLTTATRTTTLNGRSRLPRFASRAAAAMTIGGCALLSAAGSAHATVVGGVSGNPGASAVTQAAGYHDSNNYPHVRIGEVNMYRSPTYTGTQIISARYRYWVWDGNSRVWTMVARSSDQRTVPPGYRARLPGSVANLAENSRYYGVDIVMRWRTSTGGFIGRKVVDYAHQADYTCSSPWPRCSTDVVGGSGAVFLSATF